jgi:hypothetical protein
MSAGWGCFLGLVVGCAIIAAAITFGSGDPALVLVTGVLAVLTGMLAWLGFINLKIARQITWFTGSMERHSDQMRQMKAQDLGIEMIWWDKTVPDAKSTFPLDAEHGETVKLDRLYIGIPVEKRQKRPGRIARWLGAVG